ncbi:kinase-like domain-containing protein [Tricladium varicosporioides]|nr:kinase-like domain-containing protein [Hymenoscyphus varicosporioides]
MLTAAHRTYKAKVERDFITDRKLINQYEIIDEIGRGAQSKVKLARSLEREGYIAIKIIPRFSKKRRLGSVTISPEEKTEREIAVLKKTHHPNVVSLLEVIDDPGLKKIYLVLEYVKLGEILWHEFSYVPTLTIDQVRSAFRDTVLGLQYLHLEGIIHRDIKPANLLLTEDRRVKIADFGVSYFGRHIREGEVKGNTVGTPAFFAPELCCTDLDVQQPRVTEQIDIWSLGVTLYCLIYARIPFMAVDEFQLFRAIAHKELYVPKRRLKAIHPSCSTWRARLKLALEDIDEELYDLLQRMLIKDPVERIKLGEITRHPWVTRDIDNIIG